MRIITFYCLFKPWYKMHCYMFVVFSDLLPVKTIEYGK